MAGRIDFLTANRTLYVDPVDFDIERTKDHTSFSYFVEKRIDPIGEKPIRVRTFTENDDFFRRTNFRHIGEKLEKTTGCVLKSFGQTLAARFESRKAISRPIRPFSDLHCHTEIVDLVHMLIERNELQYDFGDARFDPRQDRDRFFLGWVFDQFLYGEVTGIQCGYWLYRAPTLAAASFLARQASEELSHVKRIRKIQDYLKTPPAAAHGAVKFLSTGMMGGTWGEHVCLEMALGEGLVLTIFYALATTIADENIQKIIESACLDEERHVRFGEAETKAWLSRFPSDRKVFLAQALLQWIAMRKLKNFALKKLPPGHPVLEKFPAFYDHTLTKFDLRVQKLGLSECSLKDISWIGRIRLLAELPLRTMMMRLRRPKGRLTDTYLADEWIQSPEKAN